MAAESASHLLPRLARREEKCSSKSSTRPCSALDSSQRHLEPTEPGQSPGADPGRDSTACPGARRRPEGNGLQRSATRMRGPLSPADSSGHLDDRIPATCLPLRDLLAAGLTTVLGHHPVTVRATQRPPSPSTECPSSLSGAARARAPTALAVETFEHLLLSDIRQRPPASPTPSLPLLTIPDSGPAPAKQGDTLGTDDSALCPLQTTTRH